MKKLQLKALEIGAQQVLTREQLKKMVGGDNPNCAGVTGSYDWYCDKGGTCSHVGTMSCNSASTLCSGGTITTSTTCGRMVIVPDPKPE